jgi:hypothetical protein
MTENTTTLQVKLFFKEMPTLEESTIKRELETRFNDLSINTEHNTMSIASIDHPATLGLPEMAFINLPKPKETGNMLLETSLTQSWDWQEASDVVNACAYEVLISCRESSLGQFVEKNIQEQIIFFQKLVTSLAAALQPDAIWFINSQLVLNPDYYVTNSNYRDYLNILGFVNARYYVIEQSNDVFVDTLGLHALGLPDFEFRFDDEDYNPQDVVGRLYDFSYHIVDNGVVFEHEEVIDGIYEDTHWTCLFVPSRGKPERDVIRFED